MDIDDKKRKIVIAGLALVVAMTLFPPWVMTITNGHGYIERPAGYAFIGYSPLLSHYNMVYTGIKIDVLRLSIQIVAALLLTGIGLLMPGASWKLLLSKYRNLWKLLLFKYRNFKERNRPNWPP